MGAGAGEDIIEALKRAVGRRGWLAGADVGPRYRTDPRGAGDTAPDFALRPGSTAEVSAILKICHAAGQTVTAQGGMTGLVGGALPRPGEIPISFERMTRIDPVAPGAGSMIVEAGVALQTVQDAAEAAGMLFPLDLGARGSCTIGGNLSTNAGGNRVIRYGMTRDLTLGVEAVLADGAIVNSLNGFIKNNTGYDLKQLFIGSEGTLGLITRAALRLHPRPSTQIVGFCAAADFDAVTAFMAHARAGLGADLSAFEVIWASTYARIVADIPGLRAPLPEGRAFYVLVEAMGSAPDTDRDKFETTLAEALDKGLIADAVISQSAAEVTALWDVRDGMAQALGAQQPAVGFDVSLSLDAMKDLEATLLERLTAALGAVRLFIGGHLADGNLHLVARNDDSGPLPGDAIEDIVYGLVGERGGSVSAEHGIGMMKRRHLGQSRGAAELALMRRLKRGLDPRGILNRGRIFDCAPRPSRQEGPRP